MDDDCGQCGAVLAGVTQLKQIPGAAQGGADYVGIVNEWLPWLTFSANSYNVVVGAVNAVRNYFGHRGVSSS